MIMFVTTIVLGTERDKRWLNEIRPAWLKDHPICEICGTAKDIQVHHVMIFSRHPELELDMNNLMTVCTSKYWGYNCHLIIHGGNFQYENPWAREDAEILKVFMSPAHIKQYGTYDLESYIKMMNKRIKEYNCKTYGFRCNK